MNYMDKQEPIHECIEINELSSRMQSAVLSKDEALTQKILLPEPLQRLLAIWLGNAVRRAARSAPKRFVRPVQVKGLLSKYDRIVKSKDQLAQLDWNIPQVSSPMMLEMVKNKIAENKDGIMRQIGVTLKQKNKFNVELTNLERFLNSIYGELMPWYMPPSLSLLSTDFIGWVDAIGIWVLREEEAYQLGANYKYSKDGVPVHAGPHEMSRGPNLSGNQLMLDKALAEIATCIIEAVSKLPSCTVGGSAFDNVEESKEIDKFSNSIHRFIVQVFCDVAVQINNLEARALLQGVSENEGKEISFLKYCFGVPELRTLELRLVRASQYGQPSFEFRRFQDELKTLEQNES